MNSCMCCGDLGLAPSQMESSLFRPSLDCFLFFCRYERLLLAVLVVDEDVRVGVVALLIQLVGDGVVVEGAALLEFRQH